MTINGLGAGEIEKKNPEALLQEKKLEGLVQGKINLDGPSSGKKINVFCLEQQKTQPIFLLDLIRKKKDSKQPSGKKISERPF